MQQPLQLREAGSDFLFLIFAFFSDNFHHPTCLCPTIGPRRETIALPFRFRSDRRPNQSTFREGLTRYAPDSQRILPAVMRVARSRMPHSSWSSRFRIRVHVHVFFPFALNMHAIDTHGGTHIFHARICVLHMTSARSFMTNTLSDIASASGPRRHRRRSKPYASRSRSIRHVIR